MTAGIPGHVTTANTYSSHALLGSNDIYDSRWTRCVIMAAQGGHSILVLWFLLFFFLLFSIAYFQRSEIGRLYYILPHTMWP